FGVERLWLAGNATPLTHRNVAKTALGTERLVPWEHAGTAAEAADAVRKDGLRLVAGELTADAVPLHEAPLDGDVCLAVGGEGRRRSRALPAAAAAAASVPPIGRAASPTAAVAAAIALAEARGREWSAGPAPPGRRSGRPLAEPLV